MRYIQEDNMPLSLRIPKDKEKLLREYAERTGKTKSTVIMEAVEEKLGIYKDRKTLVRELAGWMSQTEAVELRKSLSHFDEIHEDDWE
jgi:hypothetical protein